MYKTGSHFRIVIDFSHKKAKNNLVCYMFLLEHNGGRTAASISCPIATSAI